jgi:hypothetical protein
MNEYKELLEQIQNEKQESLNEAFTMHVKDELLEGFSFETLIDTVSSNESNIDAKSVTKVFNEMLKLAVDDAKFELKKNLKAIVEASKK